MGAVTPYMVWMPSHDGKVWSDFEQVTNTANEKNLLAIVIVNLEQQILKKLQRSENQGCR